MKQPQTQSKKVHQSSLHNSDKIAGKNTEKIPGIFSGINSYGKLALSKRCQAPSPSVYLS